MAGLSMVADTSENDLLIRGIAKYRDVNGIIKNSLKMPGSRGRPGGVKGQRPCGGLPPWRN